MCDSTRSGFMFKLFIYKVVERMTFKMNDTYFWATVILLYF